MSKQEFFSAMTEALQPLSDEDRRRVLDFFAETIEDRIEEGVSEEEAVSSIGDPAEVARQIVREFETQPRGAFGDGAKAAPEAEALEPSSAEERPEKAGAEEEKQPVPRDLRPENTSPACMDKAFFTSILVQISEGDVELVPAEGAADVVLEGYDEDPPKVFVENGTLNVIQENHESGSWFQRIWSRKFSNRNCKVQLQLPEAGFESLTLKTHFGDIDAQGGARFRNAALSSKYGDITGSIGVSGEYSAKSGFGDLSLSGAQCRIADFSTSAGDIEVRDFSAAEKLTIRSSAGDLKLNNLNAPSVLELHTTAGDVRWKNGIAKGKVSIETKAGDVRLNSVEVEQDAEIRSSAGDIKLEEIRVNGDLLAHTSAGDVELRSSVVAGRKDVHSSIGEVHIR